MSRWGTLHATFTGAHRDVEYVPLAGPGLPTGSESGADVVVDRKAGTVEIVGRLRDVDDETMSPLVLAWFVAAAQDCDLATLTWDVDNGPRYRYLWSEWKLSKLTGVLDL